MAESMVVFVQEREPIMTVIKRRLNPIFNPRSLALVGASNNVLKWGWIIQHNIMWNRCRGRLYPVNRSEDKVLGLRAYPSVKHVPDAIDLAIIVVPAQSVTQ